MVGYDSATAFVKALGVRALSDPEDDVGPPVEKERPLDGSAACVFIFIFGLLRGVFSLDVVSVLIFDEIFDI